MVNVGESSQLRELLNVTEQFRKSMQVAIHDALEFRTGRAPQLSIEDELANPMLSIQTSIDELMTFIERYSPVREKSIPANLRVKAFDSHINLLESKGMIEIKMPFLSRERTFIFKSRKVTNYEPWTVKKVYEGSQVSN